MHKKPGIAISVSSIAITLTFLVMVFLLTPEIIAKGDVNYLSAAKRCRISFLIMIN